MSKYKCECCGREVPLDQILRSEKHPVVTESMVVILNGCERHWVSTEMVKQVKEEQRRIHQEHKAG